MVLRPRSCLGLGLALSCLALACSSGDGNDTVFSTFESLATSLSDPTMGDDTTGPTSGDGDPGDGDPGDGDGDPGTGDGDPTTGDGDPTTGDGDPEPDLPSGGLLGVDDLAPGDLVITEIMYNPNLCDDTACEWLEVQNASGGEVDLLGLRVQDVNLSQTGTVTSSVVIADGGYAWIAKSSMGTWGYTDPADAYIGSTPAFNNSGDDQAVILNATEILDSTALYTASASGVGASWQLDVNSLDASANDSASNWCYSTQVFEVDLGTPKAANSPCP